MDSIKLILPEINGTIRISSGHFSTVEAEWSYHKHHHSTFELLHCLKGEAIEWINGNAVTLTEGDWLFLNGGVMHSTITDSHPPFSYFTVHFDTDDHELRTLLSQSDYIHFDDPDCELQPLLEELQFQLQETADYQSSPITRLKLHSLTIRMTTELLRIIEKTELKPRTSPVSLANMNLAHTIEQHLQEAIFTSDSVEWIARQLFISRNQCTQIFQKVYGLPPHRYLNMLKLKEAKKLILRTDTSIEEIGERLGFSNASSFSRQFRIWTGHAPTALRKSKIRNKFLT